MFPDGSPLVNQGAHSEPATFVRGDIDWVCPLSVSGAEQLVSVLGVTKLNGVSAACYSGSDKGTSQAVQEVMLN